MRKNTLLIIALLVLVAALLGAGIWALSGNNSAPPAQSASSGGPPTSIKVFRVEQPNFVVQGDNLGRVEIWAVRGGAPQMLGTATMQSAAGASNSGDTWIMPIPAGIRGASEIYAKGYGQNGNPAAKIDLPPQDLKNL